MTFSMSLPIILGVFCDFGHCLTLMVKNYMEKYVTCTRLQTTFIFKGNVHGKWKKTSNITIPLHNIFFVYTAPIVTLTCNYPSSSTIHFSALLAVVLV